MLTIFRYFVNGDLFHCICSEAFATSNTQSDSQFSWLLIAVTVIFFFIDSKMNTYIYASSRGKSLDRGDIFVKAKPGGKLMTLYELAKRHLKHINGTKLVYFVCGLPDICSLSRK